MGALGQTDLSQHLTLGNIAMGLADEVSGTTGLQMVISLDSTISEGHFTLPSHFEGQAHMISLLWGVVWSTIFSFWQKFFRQSLVVLVTDEYMDG